MKKIALFSLFILLTFGLILAQNPNASEPVLKSLDVENLIKNYKSLDIEFKALNINLRPSNSYEEFLNSMTANEKTNTIVRNFGYNDINEFVIKTWAIALSYAVIVISTEGTPEMEYALTQIDENASLSPEEKEIEKDKVHQFLEALVSALSSTVNAQDIETVKPYSDKLEKIFKQEINETADE